MTRQAFRVAHRWLGLALALPLLIQGVTGALLAATPVWNALRPVPAIAVGMHGTANEIVAAAAVPGMVPVAYQAPEGSSPVVVDLAPPGQRGSTLEVMVDPVSMTVLGTRQASAAYRWLHGLHENLLLPMTPGRGIVGWSGTGLLLLGLSGLVLWWPASPGRWRASLTVAKRAKGARFQRELHGAVGFWGSAMLVAMSLSGASLAFPQTIRAMLGEPGGFQRGEPASPRGNPAVSLDLDAVLARAGEALPDATVVDARLPNPPGRPVMVRLRPDGAPTGAPLAVVMVDPGSRRVVSLQDPRRQTAAMQALGWLRALHFGEAFGTPWRLLVIASGVVLPLLAITGALFWLLKRRNRLRLSSQRHAALQSVAQSRRAPPQRTLP